MPRARARSFATLSAGIAVALSITGCGSAPPAAPPTGAAAAHPPDTRADAAPLLSRVIDRMNHEGTVRSDVTGNLGIIGDLTGSGSVRYQPQQADVALDGHTRAAPNQPANPVRVAVVDEVGYLNSPLVRPEPGKPWIRISSAGADFTAKLLSPALRQLRDSTDPRATFTGVESATKIQSQTPDQVDGKPATHYDLRINTDRAATAAPDPQLRSRMRKAADSGKPELGYQLWTDPSGLPLRFTATQHVARAGDVSMTSTYRDWGAPVAIQPPPPGQIGVFGNAPLPQAQPPR